VVAAELATADKRSVRRDSIMPLTILGAEMASAAVYNFRSSP
jgi:hypothetical protein